MIEVVDVGASTLCIPCPWQGPISGGHTHDIVEFCLAVCRLHELIEEHV